MNDERLPDKLRVVAHCGEAVVCETLDGMGRIPLYCELECF